MDERTAELRENHSSVGVLRDAILKGELHPGQWLVESDIAARFDIPRPAVRAALLELQAERLVERQPNRGAKVRVVDVDEAVEIMEVRAALEGVCAARAARRASRKDRRRLRALGNDLRAAVAAGDILTYSAQSEALHGFVQQLADQETLQRQLTFLRNQSVRFHFRITLLPGYPAKSLVEHLEVIDAVEGGDPEVAEQVMRRHLHSVREALRHVDSPGNEPVSDPDFGSGS